MAGADGCVKNFFFLFDEWIAWKSKQMAKEIEVHIHQRQGEAEIDNTFVEDELAYDHFTCNEPTEIDKPLPLLWKECQPVVGKRVVTLHLQIESSTSLSALWSGNTWQFRQRLDEAGPPEPDPWVIQSPPLSSFPPTILLVHNTMHSCTHPLDFKHAKQLSIPSTYAQASEQHIA